MPAGENRHLDLSLSNPDRLCPVAKALSSPVRVRMLALLSVRAMNVNELAEALSLPVSTAALNVRHLEGAGLIDCEIQPGIRGAMKLCSPRLDSVHMRLTPEPQADAGALTLQLPIGSYSTADAICPDCGMVTERAWIGESNAPRVFYHPDRIRAQMLWFRSGELEYRFSLGQVDPAHVAFIEFSMEMAANAPLRRSGLRSDIHVAVNGVRLGTWSSPCAPGGRRGRLSPPWWSDTSCQFGALKVWHVDGAHALLDGREISGVTLADLSLSARDYVSLRVGVDAGSEAGGLCLFGDQFGDFAQGVVMRVGCAA